MGFTDGGIIMGKWSGLVSVRIFVIAIALICGNAGLSYGEIILDRVVAVVNAEVITWSELYKSMEFEASPAVKALSDQERRKLFKDSESIFLENLINTKLILQAAKSFNLGISEAEVTRTITEIKAKYGMNDEAFGKAIEKEGFTLKDYKAKLTEQLITSKLIDIEVKGKIVVTEKEINDYILRNKDAADEGYIFSLIFVKRSGNPGADEEKVKAAYEKIKGGADFAEVAKQYSEDSSARAGGAKGFVKKSDLSKEFVDAISRLKTGEVSGPFMTSTGINIVRLEESRIFSKEGDLKAAVKDKLYRAKYEKAYSAWIKGLRQKAYVDIR
jgi:peptidyl-prolyl cis-trans isomerase SurA